LKAFLSSIFFGISLLIQLQSAFGQERILSGKVSLSDDQGFVPGIAIQVEGTTRGANTDISGSYSIKLDSTDSFVIFSYLGYAKQRISINGRSSIDVVLQPEAITNDEVVIVGYGIQKKSDITGSIGRIKGEELIKVPNNNAMQALQGKVAGVQVVSASGTPGDPPKVRIRGVGTINSGNDPLYVVDGVFMKDISAINSSDIESIEVLKDASAAAIFGVEGANGVILVTTKQGKDGKVSINFSSEYGVQNLSKKISLLSGPQYGQLVNEINPGTFPGDLNALPRTDWQNEVFRNNAAIQNYQVSATGGSKSSSYYLGLGYYKQDGIIPKSNFERISIRANYSANLNDFIKIGTNLTIAPTQKQNTADVVGTLYRASPAQVARVDTGSGYAPVNGYGNPLASIDYNNSFEKGISGIGNVFAEIKLPVGFKYRFSLGFDMGYNRTVSFTPTYFVSPTQSNAINDLNTGRYTRNNSIIDNLLYYNREFGKHKIDALGGVSIYRNFGEDLSVVAQNIIRDDRDLWYLNAGQVVAATSSESATLIHKQSFFGRVNYTFSNRYIATATYRVDGSSNFGANNKYGGFPSVALGWVLSEEEFLRSVNAITNLKIRSSWGKLGNQNIDVTDRSTVINNSNQAVFGPENVLTQGATYDKSSNPNLKWETTTQFDAGVELGLLNGRLNLELDYYHRLTEDILVLLATPGHVGNGPFTKVRNNAASVLNRGLELALNWKDEIGAFSYRFGGNATTVHNEVKNLGASIASDESIIGGGLGNGQNVTLTRAGLPIGSFYGYQTDGIFQNEAEVANGPVLNKEQAPGDIRYKDLNGDGKIDNLDRTNLGSPIPTFMYGLNAGINFKNFDLSLDIQGQTGNKIYNGKAAIRPTIANYEILYKDRWKPERPSNTVPRATAGGDNFLPSNFLIQDGSFIRLRTITLSYSIPRELSSRLRLQKSSIYVRATNLVTFTKFTGYSPEVGGGDLSAGIDLGIYPITAVYAAGINVTF
jgi:TonB-linked SusC/RagA family outer membrane protein